MINLQVIGKLGGDAEVKMSNGVKMLTFNVSHNFKYRDNKGVERETAMWISCVKYDFKEELVKYLVSGRWVYVEGYCSARTYFSTKTRMQEAGLNLNVFKLELIGSAPSPVPVRLYTEDGEEVKVDTLYSIGRSVPSNILLDRKGRRYLVDGNNFVTQEQDTAGNENTNGSASHKDNNDGVL